MPFDTRNHSMTMQQEVSIMENAKKLAKFGGGGTNCSLPLQKLNQENAKGDLVLYISDNESWADGSSSMMKEWATFKKRNPNAKLICWDITPNTTSQAKSQQDVLNVAGASDTVFEVIKNFCQSGSNQEFVKEIEAWSLNN